MTTWLMDLIRTADPDRRPEFARLSNIHWMLALAHEIIAEHGPDDPARFQSCRTHFARQSIVPFRGQEALTFEMLWQSLLFAMTLTSQAAHGDRGWTTPSGVINWYYCLYGGLRAMFAVKNMTVKDNHTAAMRTFTANLRPLLPHPFNMLASYHQNEHYAVTLPSHPTATAYDLVRSFTASRTVAQGMLVAYLSGTATWYLDRTKEQILQRSRGAFSNFRTTAARAVRDQQAIRELGFFHCAFRYRGKSNYRDAVFVTYGAQVRNDDRAYLEALALVARFFFLMSLAFVEYVAGTGRVRAFVQDVNRNMKGVVSATATERFWSELGL